MSGPDLDSGVRLVAGVLLLLVALAALRTSPKYAVVAWLLTVCFIPVWIGVNAGAFFSANMVISILVAFSLFPLQIRWSPLDAVFGVILLVVAAEGLIGVSTRAAIFDATATWASAFLLGRIIVQVVSPVWIYRAVAIIFTVVAGVALLEFITSTNLFVTYLANNTRSFDLWGVLQPRGDVLRAEGAFGHSIALGSSLGIAVALTMGADFRTWLKVGMIAVMAAATVATFSRTGMITSGLSIVLACFFQREGLTRTSRRILLTSVVLGAAVAFPLVRDVFAASDEADGSASYRSDLLELAYYMQPFGLASNYAVSTTQVVSIGSFASIDNAALLFGLIYGWVPLVLLGLLLVGGIVTTLRRRCTPATIAIVAQIPAFVTVALITQYASVVWFAIGLAVSTQLLASASRTAQRVFPRHALAA